MIRSSVWGNLKATLSSVPNGNYQVYFYTWEDNYSETYSVKLNGMSILNNIISGEAGSWARRGPFPVSATTGSIVLESLGGAMNLSGLEIYSIPAPTPTPSPSPTPNPTPSPTPAPNGVYRAINLNGSSFTSGGVNFEASGSAPNFSVINASAFANQSIALNPAVGDSHIAAMIRSSVWGTGVRAVLSSVPAGSYQVYVYTWEDNSAETYHLKLQASTVLANASSGAAGSWRKLGPYPALVGADGLLSLESSGGAFNLSGIEVRFAETFVRAINFGGPAAVIEGKNFEASSSAAQLTVAGSAGSISNQSVALIPGVSDPAKAQMIRSSVWGRALQIGVGGLSAGAYRVYLYVWEDNAAANFSVKLEGQTAAANVNSGSAGSWQKLGPYSVTVNDGALSLELSGGDANLSGIEIYR